MQGVCFRASTREQALKLGLRGYAKNLPDGRVEVLAEGDERALDALERWLHVGPPAAGSKLSNAVMPGSAKRGRIRSRLRVNRTKCLEINFDWVCNPNNPVQQE